MYKKVKPLFLHCQTPLHAGSGNDLGIVDLPIQREKHTGFPKIEASSLKGSIREAFEEKANDFSDKINIHKTFGFDKDGISEEIKKEFKGREEFSGCLGFSDARLLLFPVKSMKGVFAWITCPQILEKFKSEMELCDIKDVPNLPKESSTPQNCNLFIGNTGNIVLEEYTFKIQNKDNKNTSDFGIWIASNVIADDFSKEKIRTDLVVLSNDDFRDFVNLSTEVITRTKIDNKTGTVVPGALFTEEYLPSESIMYSMVFLTNEFTKKESSLNLKEVEDFVSKMIKKNVVMQIGGNATHGKGLVRTKLMERAE